MRLTRNLLAAMLLAAVAMPASASGANRLVTGVQDPLDPVFRELDRESAYPVARAMGVNVVRVPVAWSGIAPQPPAAPSDPVDPAYDWGWLDERVSAIRGAGLEPLLVLYSTPAWARFRGPDGRPRNQPRPDDFAAFAGAAARRYDGAFLGLPRVRYWQIWNEPNYPTYFAVAGGTELYRENLNAAYSAIHAAVADNTVVAGGLTPFSADGGLAPLDFMRALLCMSGYPRPKPSCDARSYFDVWSHHPYTAGGPSHQAIQENNASLGDLPDMRRLLSAARRAGHVVSRGSARFWVTEFSWESKPMDPFGVPLRVHGRWVAEALYRMWRNGVSLVSWFALRDGPPAGRELGFTLQGGLFFRTTERYADERAKPAARAFEFPFVAVPQRGRVILWGRTPDSRRHTVTVERRVRGRWHRLRRVRTNAHGIFLLRRKDLAGAVLRARVGRSRSLPFKAVRTRDRPTQPFGE
jgi:hypothetical protein